MKKRLAASSACLLLGATVTLGAVAGVGTAGPIPSDQLIAKRAQFRLSDLPVGWRTAASSTESSPSKCFGPRLANATGKSESEFAKGEMSSAMALVAVEPSPSIAAKAFAVLGSDKTWTCLAAELKKETRATDVQQGRFLLGKVGAPTVGRELIASYKVEGISASASAYVHFDVSRKDRVVIVLMHLAMFSPAMTINEEATALRRMVARLP